MHFSDAENENLNVTQNFLDSLEFNKSIKNKKDVNDVTQLRNCLEELVSESSSGSVDLDDLVIKNLSPINGGKICEWKTKKKISASVKQTAELFDVDSEPQNSTHVTELQIQSQHKSTTQDHHSHSKAQNTVENSAKLQPFFLNSPNNQPKQSSSDQVREPIDTQPQEQPIEQQKPQQPIKQQTQQLQRTSSPKLIKQPKLQCHSINSTESNGVSRVTKEKDARVKSVMFPTETEDPRNSGSINNFGHEMRKNAPRSVNNQGTHNRPVISPLTDSSFSSSLDSSDLSESSREEDVLKTKRIDETATEWLNRHTRRKLTELKQKWTNRIKLENKQLNEILSKYHRLEGLLETSVGVESGRTQQWPGSIRSFAGGMHRTALAEGFLFEELGVAGGDGRIPGVSGKQDEFDDSSLSSSSSVNSLPSFINEHSCKNKKGSEYQSKSIDDERVRINLECRNGLSDKKNNENLDEEVAEADKHKMEVLMEKLNGTLDKINANLSKKIVVPRESPHQPRGTTLLRHYNDLSLERTSKSTSTTVLQQINTQLNRFHSDDYKDAVDRMLEKRWHTYFGGLPKPLPVGSHLNKYLYNVED